MLRINISLLMQNNETTSLNNSEIHHITFYLSIKWYVPCKKQDSRMQGRGGALVRGGTKGPVLSLCSQLQK